MRKPTDDELRLIDFLIKKSSIVVRDGWKSEIMVKTMGDGGMGSLQLFPNRAATENRKPGSRVSEIIFKDQDQIEVFASLFIDFEGNLYELDLWKVNFEPLSKIPTNLE